GGCVGPAVGGPVPTAGNSTTGATIIGVGGGAPIPKSRCCCSSSARNVCWARSCPSRNSLCNCAVCSLSFCRATRLSCVICHACDQALAGAAGSDGDELLDFSMEFFSCVNSPFVAVLFGIAMIGLEFAVVGMRGGFVCLRFI